MARRKTGSDRPDDEFLARLAHEFRNPLASIRSAVEIMDVIGPKDHALEKAREMILRQVEQLSGLVDQLLGASTTRDSFDEHAAPGAVLQPRQAAPSTQDPAGRDTPRRIVVIDDNVDAAESLAMLLRLKGHEVHVAYDGPAGVELTTKAAPDCVLVDIGLPGIDGYEVAKRLRAHRSDGLLLVALTGYGQAGDRIKSEQAGFDHHLVKPVSHSVLDDILRER